VDGTFDIHGDKTNARTGDSELLSGFPCPINGNPDNNLELSCIFFVGRIQEERPVRRTGCRSEVSSLLTFVLE
jgi:hypothetical protein